MLGFTQFLKARNYVCIYYQGSHPKHLAQLKEYAAKIEQTFPDLHVSIFAKGELPLSQLLERKNDFIYIKEIAFSNNMVIDECLN